MSTRWTRWTRAQARDVVKQLDSSGLSIVEFARRHHQSPERLRRWRTRFRQEAEGPALVELLPKPSAPTAQLRIHCPSGHTVELVDVELLAGLRAALAATAGVAPC